MSAVTQRVRQAGGLLGRPVLTVGGLAIGLATIALTVLVAYRASNAERIFPGVSVDHLAVGGIGIGFRASEGRCSCSIIETCNAPQRARP